ncbi:hypothetical protein X907_1457 [Glycocaulis alkaliphilus]|uniref:Uncharacterized protein n=1 Tax=Glycocaulis alkaliphilus TaxID=1434191 RepID=A0A3T0E9Q4_9PROT|nr:hypothetical protein [Glycocaulis alkaliphilus]AZU03990.1 hypothetical protein X907_1457 [Glycocaulis alkaliphilus]GGB74888.1 hypothetical protein GCM10007417_13390 [Glycocaulis alkaliphilus]
MAFSFWKALGYGVKRVRERPVEAARIWAFDAAFIIVLPFVLLAVSGAWTGQGGRITLDGLPPAQAFAALAIFFSMSVFWLCSEGAWARFLATDEPAGIIPYRLGKDELRIFGLLVAWSILAIIIAFCMMMPIALLATMMADGVVAGRASAGFFAVLLMIAGMFILPRVNTSLMLAVRRKAFNPMYHFSATDPFWFRLGLAFGVGVVFALLLAYALPLFLAFVLGFDGPARLVMGGQSMTPWAEWFAVQKSPQAGHALIVLIAWLGSGAGMLVARGIYAHAALNALEQHQLDARHVYPAGEATTG